MVAGLKGEVEAVRSSFTTDESGVFGYCFGTAWTGKLSFLFLILYRFIGLLELDSVEAGTNSLINRSRMAGKSFLFSAIMIFCISSSSWSWPAGRHPVTIIELSG